ncbi:MAG: 3-hydroxyacyl-CoA dehydrogenase NAD-binding domain-containing protein [Terriglobales bacterium]
MFEVRTIAVIGAGAMGRSIAQVAALGGYRTVLEDLFPHSLRRAGAEIRAYLEQSAQLGEISAREAEVIFSRLEYAGSVDEAGREADLVIEAVPDELESKLEIFIMLDKFCRPGTILAANTSALSISQIATATYRARKCIGMRFSHPVHAMTRLEIVRASETDDETLAAVIAVGQRMRKEVVVLDDVPVPANH